MASFMEILQTSCQLVKTPLPSPIPAVQLFQAIFSCRAANKEVQHVIDTINDGTVYLLGALMSIATLQGKDSN